MKLYVALSLASTAALLTFGGCDSEAEPAEPLALEWAVPYQEFPRGLLLDPLLAEDGRVLTAADGFLTLREGDDGETVWQEPWPGERDTFEREWTTDGEVVFVAPAEQSVVSAYEVATGERLWQGSLPANHEFYFPSQGATDEAAVYFPTRSGDRWFMAKFDRATGQRLGLFLVGGEVGSVFTSRVVNGVLVVGQSWGGTNDAAGAVVGLDPDSGAELWRYEVDPGTGVFTYAALWDAGGRVYAGTYLGSGRLVCLNATTGEPIWEVDGVGPNATELVETPSGLRLFLNTGTTVRAFDADTGRQLWAEQKGSHGEANVAYANGVLYHGHGGSIYAFDAETGEHLAQVGTGASVFDMEAAAEHGRLYVLGGGQLEARTLIR